MANSNNKIVYQYLAAALPAIVTVGGWQAAAWAFDYLGCRGDIKHLEPCFAGGVNLMPAIGFGLFWCQLVMWICVPISGGKLVGVASRKIAARFGWQDLVIWPPAKKQVEPRRGRYRRRAWED